MPNATGIRFPNKVEAISVYAYSPGDFLEVTLSLNTSAYADGDVLAAVQEVTNALQYEGQRAVIISGQVLDEDDQAGALDIVIARSNITLGTENSPVSITDADARDIVAILNVAATDYNDLINSQMAEIEPRKLIEGAETTRSLWVGAISRDAKTYSASGLRVRLGILYC